MFCCAEYSESISVHCLEPRAELKSLFFADPKVLIDPLSWRGDVVTVAVLGTLGAALLLLALAAGFWYSKSRHRHLERLERRNSIRQSLHSVRSAGLASAHGGFTEIGVRKKPTSVSLSLLDFCC
jgi:hypothetical protein